MAKMFMELMLVCFELEKNLFCRDDWTRTSGLYVPNVARYQLRHIPKNCAGHKSKKNIYRV